MPASLASTRPYSNPISLTTYLYCTDPQDRQYEQQLQYILDFVSQLWKGKPLLPRPHPPRSTLQATDVLATYLPCCELSIVLSAMLPSSAAGKFAWSAPCIHQPRKGNVCPKSGGSYWNPSSDPQAKMLPSFALSVPYSLFWWFAFHTSVIG